MAKVKQPLRSDDAAGTIGQDVHRRRGNTHIVQARPTKEWVDSDARAEFRHRAAIIHQDWTYLSDEDKATWVRPASTTPCKGRLSHESHLTPEQLFTQRTHLRFYLMASNFTTFPGTVLVPPIYDLQFYTHWSGIGATWYEVPGTPPEQWKVLFYVHGPIPGAQRGQRRTAVLKHTCFHDTYPTYIPITTPGRYAIWTCIWDSSTGLSGPEWPGFYTIEP